jgi:hypothetical protein
MIEAAMRASPAPFFGHGWGRTQDAFHSFLNVTGENLWRPTWVFLTSDYFNSHNWILETIYSIGVPGLILAVIAAVQVPLSARPLDRPAATALVVVCLLFTGIWFQLCLSLPLMALATAAVSSPARVARAPYRLIPIIVVTALAVLQFAAAGSLASFGAAMTRMQENFTDGLPLTVPDDPRGSDLAAAEMIRDCFLELAHPRARQRRRRDTGAKAMVAYLDRTVMRTETTQLPIIALGILSQAYFSGELAWLEGDMPDIAGRWPIWLDRALTLAPGRTDIAIPYLTRLATTGQSAEAEALTRRMLRQAPDDAVALYFAGILELSKAPGASKQTGIGFLRRSVAAGIDRFMPIAPSIHDLINAQWE